MRLHTPYRTVAARALARALRLLAVPLVLSTAAGVSAQPPDPADPESVPLAFVPCAGEPILDCGVLDVPVDYEKPGRTVGLAVARARALDPAQRIGVLFVHPGGHASGVAFLRNAVNMPIFQTMRQRFDIVSLDPRGTGGSRPLHCDFELPAPPAEDDDASVIAYLDRYSRLVAQQCLDDDADFVRSISGHNFARDIDHFRSALGEKQLSFAMASNSGPVAAVYASLFPKRVRAMIIDSPVAGEHRDYWLERRIEQGDSYERTLQRTDQICRRHPDCPLRTIGVVNAFDQVRARLNAEPIPLPNAAAFTGEAFADTFFLLLPAEGLWNPMVGALAEALEGNVAPFINIATSGGGGDDGIVARFCNDYGTRRTAADYLPAAEAAGGVHPRFFDRDQLLADLALCAAWPKADPPPIRSSADRLAVPVLTFHSQFDSDAPFAWSHRLAHAMGDDRHVVRYQGGGHGVIDRQQPCIRDTVNAYLFDLKLPQEDLACPAEVTAPRAEAFAPTALARPVESFATSEAPLRLSPR